MTTARRLTPATARKSTEVWGWCAVCQRWFYPGQPSHDVTCPVCATAADKTAERPES